MRLIDFGISDVLAQSQPRPPVIVGVYFLLQQSWPVYIGSAWDVFKRLHQHISEGKKKFDAYTIYELPPDTSLDVLLETEAQYIFTYNPVYNLRLPASSTYKTLQQLKLAFQLPVSVIKYWACTVLSLQSHQRFFRIDDFDGLHGFCNWLTIYYPNIDKRSCTVAIVKKYVSTHI